MHVIRLRRPWDRIDAQTQQRQRIDVPEPPSDEDSPRSVTYRRRFNRPTGLVPDTAIRLRISGWAGELTALSLNDQSLPVGAAPLEVDLSGRLEPHNSLQLTLAPGPDGAPPRLSGEVTLVIDE